MKRFLEQLDFWVKLVFVFVFAGICFRDIIEHPWVSQNSPERFDGFSEAIQSKGNQLVKNAEHDDNYTPYKYFRDMHELQVIEQEASMTSEFTRSYSETLAKVRDWYLDKKGIYGRERGDMIADAKRMFFNIPSKTVPLTSFLYAVPKIIWNVYWRNLILSFFFFIYLAITQRKWRFIINNPLSFLWSVIAYPYSIYLWLKHNGELVIFEAYYRSSRKRYWGNVSRQLVTKLLTEFKNEQRRDKSLSVRKFFLQRGYVLRRSLLFSIIITLLFRVGLMNIVVPLGSVITITQGSRGSPVLIQTHVAFFKEVAFDKECIPLESITDEKVCLQKFIYFFKLYLSCGFPQGVRHIPLMVHVGFL